MSRLARILAFASVFLGLAALPAQADDHYTVRNIHVDASAASVTEAYSIALAQGRPRAFQTLYRRLSRQADWAKQPQLSDLDIQRLMRSYTVANERRSTTRYTGDVTYVFNPDQVRRLLKNTGVAYADASAKRILIIPMAPGYNRMSAWTIAWNNPKLLHGTVPLALPVGDAADMAALGHLNFDSAAWGSVSGLAARAQASEVALLLVTGNTVRIHHLAPTPISTGAVQDVPFAGGLGGAAATTTNALEDYWKSRAAIDFSKRARATVTARFDSLGEWATMLSALSAVPTVTNVEVVAIDSGEARLGVTYVGSIDQVSSTLTGMKVALNQTDGGAWSLSAAQASTATP
jgi:hypothetical protein